MGWFDDDGYLYLNINTSLQTICITIAVICSISLLIQCAISITAVAKMRRNPRASRRLQACFVLSSISGCSYTAGIVILAVVSDQIYAIQSIAMFINFLILQSISMFWLFLLCTFILKLYLTFRSSAFEMSQTMIRLFALIVIMFFVLSSTGNILFVFFEISFEPLFFSTWILYIFGCVLAVYFFATNLLKLAKLQGQAMSPRTPSPSDLSVLQNDIKLSPRQQKSVDLATKSMMLFAIQMGSTIVILMILMFAFPIEFRAPFACFDITLNLLCSYYQFGFAQKHYRNCCGFCDDKFQGIMLNWIKRRVVMHSLSRSQAETYMANVHSTSLDTKTIQCV